MRRAARSKDQLADFPRMIKREELRNSSAHRMAAYDSPFQTKMIQHGGRIGSKHVCAVFGGRFARQARPTIVKNDYAVIARKLRDLINLPHSTIACGLTEKKKRRPIARDFIVDVHTIFGLNIRHSSSRKK